MNWLRSPGGGTNRRPLLKKEILHAQDNTRSASDVYAISITNDNAGAGNPGGIDMSSFAANEPLLNVPVDTTAEAAYYGRMAVYVTGVGIKYVSLYEA